MTWLGQKEQQKRAHGEKLRRRNYDCRCPLRNAGPKPDLSAAESLLWEAGIAAGLPFPIHPHMLRHACGFYLANKGVDTRALQQYLGHRNIQHTVRYSELTPQRFQDFWED